METPMYENITQTQISLLNGFKKLKTPGFCLTGFFIIMLIPSDIKGLLKSITLSRSEVIVMGAIAMSASCKQNRTHPLFVQVLNNNFEWLLRSEIN